MDRLPLVALVLLSCGEGEPTTTPPPSRVAAIAAAPPKPADLDAFCDFRPAAEAAPSFQLPALDGPAPTPAPGWTWVNVWATWCAPCLEEMPRLLEWERTMTADGARVSLQLVSADDDSATVTTFAQKHAWAARSVRVTDPEQLSPWLASFGWTEVPVLPLNLFVDSEGRLRCAKMGAISAEDRESVRMLVSGS